MKTNAAFTRLPFSRALLKWGGGGAIATVVTPSRPKRRFGALAFFFLRFALFSILFPSRRVDLPGSDRDGESPRFPRPSLTPEVRPTFRVFSYFFENYFFRLQSGAAYV